MNSCAPITLTLADEAETIRLGEDLALALHVGDCLALSGDLGAGKSTLARAFLRAMADDEALEVPSPTFTLVQTYDLRIPVAHFDLYRIADGSELDELGLDESLNDGICLVEWPEMAEAELPADRITLRLTHQDAGRQADIEGPDAALERIRRVLLIRNFLKENGHTPDRRRYLTGDASQRAYETVRPHDGVPLVLMDWPRRASGPAVLDGKPYPKVAHIAEDILPFVGIDLYLKQCGLCAPDVLAADYEHGLLLLEHLGSEGVLSPEGEPLPERYRAAIECLAHLHACLPVQKEIAVDAGHVHLIPDFDPVAMKIETRLILDWYLPSLRGGEPVAENVREEYGQIWDSLIGELSNAERHLLLRDFHSPNLIWRDQEQDLARIGLIDFQDAMIGPTAYDVASLVQDARVTIPEALAHDLLEHYVALRHAQGAFDEHGFRKAFAIMSAQRNCKLAGLWVRLKERDGKPGYMKHMPRTLRYLSTVLAHPALAPLADWMAKTGIVE
ncbi:tRNA (adenosine(37)-N6)-threonylcarbamoyltransferase complex ATPase subunit type 1 TsaE [Rhizobium helianthi]|uniref:tRNA threonylcarbamoyladenosine biosynthesis protein TsaE n=1 Tax=Rhizobium helianthi TaxID=1132695 RepID=A0ABW4M9S7_9HYPH